MIELGSDEDDSSSSLPGTESLESSELICWWTSWLDVDVCWNEDSMDMFLLSIILVTGVDLIKKPILVKVYKAMHV